MFEPTAGRLQLDINSLLVNIYIHTGMLEKGNIHCVCPFTGPNQTWEIGRVSMITMRYVGKREEKNHHGI